jgi:hypothetical protein
MLLHPEALVGAEISVIQGEQERLARAMMVAMDPHQQVHMVVVEVAVPALLALLVPQHQEAMEEQVAAVL